MRQDSIDEFKLRQEQERHRARLVAIHSGMFKTHTKLSILKALLTKRAPYYIQFFITGRCDLRCRHCNIVETNSALQDMTLDRIRQVAQNIRAIGGGIVLLTGGEPFLRRDLPSIVEIFRDQQLDVRLQTNGFATDDQLNQVYAAGARDINVSLDSLDELKQDYINAVPGSWKRAIDAVERISVVFGKRSAITSLGCVLSALNYREIPAILEFATAIGWHLSLVPVHIATLQDPMGFRSFDEQFDFRPDQLEELHDILSRILEMKRGGALLFDSEEFIWSTFNFVKNKKPTWRHKEICDSPDLYFAVRPNGDMAVCCDHQMDNPPSLFSPSFVEDYRNGSIREQCRKITSACSGCHYGSYPEVTISVRNMKALWERVRMTMSPVRSRITSKSERGHFFSVIDEIKQRHPTAYADEGESTEDSRFRRWSDPEARKAMKRDDDGRRAREGRVRSSGRERG